MAFLKKSKDIRNTSTTSTCPSYLKKLFHSQKDERSGFFLLKPSRLDICQRIHRVRQDHENGDLRSDQDHLIEK